MKLIATMGAGGNHEDTVSVTFDCAEKIGVDHYVLIDTGESAQKTIAYARERFGDRVTVFKTDQDPYTSCSGMRNQSMREALDCAECFEWIVVHREDEHETEREVFEDCWQLILDADFILDPGGDDIRAFLEQTTASIVSFNCVTGAEWRTKPLLYRLPADYGTWVRDPHEYFETREHTVCLPSAIYDEHPKNGQQWRAWSESVRDQLLAKGQLDQRDQWFLADAYDRLGDNAKAIELYHASSLGTDMDNAANAYWRIARIRERQGDRVAAINACDEGLARCPSYPEFHWLAGTHEYYLGNRLAAHARALRAIELSEPLRVNPRNSWAKEAVWFELSWELLAFALAALGNYVAEQMSWEEADRLYELRTGIPRRHPARTGEPCSS
jgi:tetratricopeptide (TPR) repeat protein